MKYFHVLRPMKYEKIPNVWNIIFFLRYFVVTSLVITQQEANECTYTMYTAREVCPFASGLSPGLRLGSADDAVV